MTPCSLAVVTLPVSHTSNNVLWFVLIATGAVILWLATKALAFRGSALPLSVFSRFDPTVQAIRSWVGRAPAVFTYIAIWTVTSIISQGQPALLNDVVGRYQSTNIVSLVTQPLRVLFSSAFIVADNALGFIGYVLVYVLIAARLEHRIGSVRWIFVAAASHVLGSLLTVSVEVLAIHRGWAPESLALAVDVGVSYVMVGSVGAYIWLVGARMRPWYIAALVAGVGAPMVISHTIWDLGHFLATVVGIGAGWIATQFTLRPAIQFRATRRALSARELPTFDSTAPR